ncbi:hypothetical protein DFP72DRAFT_1075648 [Ephemerocybe angulata]|uniref:DUF6699 domain-containing protein n=1 Tax=Ephemerocybe angulata TaxID=980116 RepID=A0A8H6HHP1_9AGAR|nr:hypothetical protein DFP72DRAFT_1075648 [Tulosesus angulatus]
MNFLDLHLRVPEVSSRQGVQPGPETEGPEDTGEADVSSWLMPPPLLRRPTVPLPPIVPGSTQSSINWLLEASLAPKIIWDLGIRPQHARSACHDDEWRPKWLEWPATNPPVLSMTLRAEKCEKAIVIHAGVPRRPFVTIRDVLSQVFRAPKCAVNSKAICHCTTCLPESQDGIGSTSRRSDIPADSLLLHPASSSRRARRPRADESTAGPRVSRQGKHKRDSYMKKGRWIGLRASSKERDVWELVLDQE